MAAPTTTRTAAVVVARAVFTAQSVARDALDSAAPEFFEATGQDCQTPPVAFTVRSVDDPSIEDRRSWGPIRLS